MKYNEKKVILKILSRIMHPNSRWCVEFGAWDGLAGSNTRELILKKKFSAVLIEGNPKRFSLLQANYQHYPDVICRNRYVANRSGQPDSLDNILASTPIPRLFDFLSVDVDGNDYHIWESLRQYRPKLVCIEINPTIPRGVVFIQKRDPQAFHGSSLTAMTQLGTKKGYELVAATEINAFFLQRQLVPKLRGIHLPYFRGTMVTHLFAGLDGTIFLRGYQKHPGHEIPYSEKKFQIMPFPLLCLPGYHQGFQKVAFTAWLILRHFDKFKRAFIKRIGRRKKS